MSNATDFLPFPRLPLELRRKIWLWTLPRPRVLTCCWAIPTPIALQINAEARSIALEHFEFIPRHISNRREDRHCIGHVHSCNWGYIDFSVDHIASNRRIRHQCIDKTPLRDKTWNLHTAEFEWRWAAVPTEFPASRWVLRHLLLSYSRSVRRILVLVHMDEMREIPPDQRGQIVQQMDAVQAVMMNGLIELKAAREADPARQHTSKWKDWTVPQIRFQRCPCSWAEGPLYPTGPECRANFFVLDKSNRVSRSISNMESGL
ncbi:hypothetical protein BKA65DRAFT_519294 [Rhexocercosporidium sp. MPI-PUGE-AT-0058]|nr:hypothetical protein BKA65DRAFT_519294 [Rhexocercosporidium sp. MPI-PUGE-AT-0058]